MMRLQPRRAARPGFTLMELAVSTGIVSLVITSLASVVVLASKALPTSSSAAGSAVGAASAADQLIQDLRFATRITTAAPDRIAFTVPDRTGDNIEDTLAYSWGGAGSPLLRSMNGGTPVAILARARDFKFAYDRQKHTETKTVNVVENSDEVLLCSFNGWPGVSHSFGAAQLNLLRVVGQRFVVDKIKIPADVTSWRITRVSAMLRNPSVLNLLASVRVAIHHPSSPGSSIPQFNPIGSADIIPTSRLTTTFTWQDATFNDVIFTDPTLDEFIIVFRPALATDNAYLRFYTSASAPVDEYVYRYSNDSALLSWSPSSNLHYTDVPFFVYGRYERNGTTVEEVDSYTVSHIGVTIQADSTSRSRIVSGVHLANQPEAPAP